MRSVALALVFAMVCLPPFTLLAQEISVNSETVTIQEGGTAEFTVALSEQPSARVTVEITGHTGTDVTLDVTTLRFSRSSWSIAQTVTVTAAEDNDGLDEEITLKLAASRGGFGGVSQDVVVTVTDNDAVWLDIPGTSKVVIQEGGKGTFSVALSEQPSARVTVEITGHTGDVTLDVTTLRFSRSSWSIAQTVTVTAAEDHDLENDALTLTLTASGGQFVGVTATVEVTVTDNDAAGLTLSSSSLALTEGGKGKFTVALSAQPSARVTVKITGHTGTDVTLDVTTLRFSPLMYSRSSWSIPQTVTVTAAEDDDDFEDDALTLTFTASGGGFGGVSKQVAVTVTDNDVDAAGFTLSSSSLALTEGGKGTFTVALSARPLADVLVRLVIAPGASTNLKLEPTRLTFTRADWSVAQTVTVTAEEDDDFADEEATLVMGGSGGGYDRTGEMVAVAVTDNDEAQMTISATSVTVSEGDNVSFTVVLSGRPSADVTVTLSGHEGNGVLNSPSRGKFIFFSIRSNWSQPQTLSLQTHHDFDVVDKEFVLRLEASGGEFTGQTADVTVTVTDIDDPELTIAPSPIYHLFEGHGFGINSPLIVRLSHNPVPETTVRITGHDGTDVTPDRHTLVFNSALPQRVQFQIKEDDDFVDDAFTLTFTASGGGFGGLSKQVAVTVTDNDAAGMTLSSSSVALTEGGTGAFSVALVAQPSAAVTVALSGHAGTDVTPDVKSLTFTRADWSVAKTVELTAAEDDDLEDDAFTLTLTASGGGFGGLSKQVAVTVTDNDAAGMTIPTSVVLAEGGTQDFSVALSQQPLADVTVALSGHAGTDVSPDVTTLAFTRADWSVAKTVELTAAEDDDYVDDAFTLVLTASGGGFDGVSEEVAVTVTDNDVAGLTIPISVAIPEGGTGDFTVALSGKPTADVTVTLSGHAGTDVTPNPTSLTFTQADWSVAKTVELTAAEDDDVENDEITLTLTALGGGFGGVSQEVAVTVTDNDAAGLTLSSSSVALTEGGTGAFTVALSQQPLADVTVTLSGHAGTDVSPDVTSLKFMVTNWRDARTVTLTAAEDDDVADDALTLTLTASGEGFGGVSQEVAVTVTDNDAAGLTLSSSSVALSEGGTGAFTVALSAQPLADVTVALSGHAGTDVTPDVTTLAFTRAEWSVAQTVDLTAAEDDDVENDAVTLVLTASGGGFEEVRKTMVVTVTDNDVAGLTIPTSVVLAEGGTGEFTVALSQQPSADVMVALSGDAGTDVRPSVRSLTFTTTSWREARAVTLTAAEDDDLADDALTLVLTASGGGYDGVSNAVAVTVTDNDVAGLTVSLFSVALPEGGTGEFTVALSAQPSADVTVALSGHAGTDVNPSVRSLTFTTTSWRETQTVALTAAQDEDYIDDEVTLVLTASGGGYDGVSNAVAVTVTDNDVAGLTFIAVLGSATGRWHGRIHGGPVAAALGRRDGSAFWTCRHGRDTESDELDVYGGRIGAWRRRWS